MLDEVAKRLRLRAQDCRNLAKGARHNTDRIMLEDMAADLEEEADTIDAEEAAKPQPAPGDQKS